MDAGQRTFLAARDTFKEKENCSPATGASREATAAADLKKKGQ